MATLRCPRFDCQGELIAAVAAETEAPPPKARRS